MKRILVLFISLILSMTIGYNSFSQEKGYFQNIVVESKFVYYPMWGVEGVENLVHTKAQWLQISLKYVTAKKESNTEKGSFQWLDDVVMECEVLLPTRSTGKNKYILLTGQVTYWSICLDGKEHKEVAFISPHFLRRYAPTMKLNNKTLKETLIKITFKVNDAIVGGGYQDPERTKLFKTASTSLNLLRVKNAVLGRDKTPWHYLYMEQYEMIKPKD